MTPGDPSIRKTFDKICPRIGGEQIPVWLSRVARVLGLPVKRINSLYYDRRCELSDAEGQSLRNALRISGHPATKLPPQLSELIQKLEQQDDNIKRLERELARQTKFKHALGALLASH